MSIWSWFIGEKNNESTRTALGENNEPLVPSYDASRLQPQTKQATVVTGMENAPRQVSKPVENLSGAVQTGASVSQNVNTQTANPNPSNVYSS